MVLAIFASPFEGEYGTGRFGAASTEASPLPSRLVLNGRRGCRTHKTHLVQLALRIVSWLVDDSQALKRECSNRLRLESLFEQKLKTNDRFQDLTRQRVNLNAKRVRSILVLGLWLLFLGS